MACLITNIGQMNRMLQQKSSVMCYW